ncbi:hypothetical protein C8R46DRAFT_1056565 [Mycena filopes]|nr:hypothetical protein C8R46DRAFT_1056565 [Mycena filopes]
MSSMEFSSTSVPPDSEITQPYKPAQGGQPDLDSDRSEADLTHFQVKGELLPVLQSDRALVESSSRRGSASTLSRRVPLELLVEIFDLCLPADSDIISDATTPEEEVNRLTKLYLLQLSQVCSSWHAVAMHTPRLWSTIAVDTGTWRESSRSSATLLGLLAALLLRSATHPLGIAAAIDSNDFNAPAVVAMLGQHSQRWKSVYLWIDPAASSFLAHIRGNLQSLEQLILVSGTGRPHSFDVFTSAPRLTNVLVRGWPPGAPPTLPWAQLLRWSDSSDLNVGFFLDVIPLLPSRACCELIVYPAQLRIPFDVPPLMSSITSLIIGFRTQNEPLDPPLLARPIVGAILESLTLPCLTTFRLLSYDDPAQFPAWDQSHFLDFASRSALYTTLRLLEVVAIIAEFERIPCLLALPSLEELRLHDLEVGPALITGHLLRRLTWSPDEENLVPNLKALSLRFPDLNVVHLRSVLEWHPLLQFVTSRILPGRSDRGPFALTVAYTSRPGDREASLDFLAQILALKATGEVRFHIDTQPPWIPLL